MTKKTRAKMRRALLTLSLVLVVAFAAVGGTIAWLTDTTAQVKNTFTPTTIDIELDENTQKDENYQFEMVPGTEIAKDPFVTVKGTEANPCEAIHLFVKITESANCDAFITYAVDNSKWEKVAGYENLYYMAVGETTADTNYQILKDNKVTVNSDVTKADMDALINGTATEPTLAFDAYAIQQANVTKDAAIVEAVKVLAPTVSAN